jgi:hypothetical protein
MYLGTDIVIKSISGRHQAPRTVAALNQDSGRQPKDRKDRPRGDARRAAISYPGGVMMNARNLKTMGRKLALLLLLGGCSGEVSVDLDGPQFPDIPPIPLSEAISSHGVITGFAGLSVNSVHYDVTGTTVSINGHPATVADLRRGQVVTLAGRIHIGDSTGIADSVRFDADLIGPVSYLDAANTRLTVLGHIVTTGQDTVFGYGIDPQTFDGLEVGDTIRVSGLRDAAGDIRATRIDHSDATEQQVIGHVAGLDAAMSRFAIRALPVDYGSAVLIDLPGGAPATGMRVKVIGMLVNGTFLAERLESAQWINGTTGQRIQLAGLVTGIGSPTDFAVDGATITAGAWTSFVNGDTDDIQLDAELLVDGDLGSGGSITARRISFGRPLDAVAALSFDVANFTRIAVPTVFSITVSQGTEYSVDVLIDAAAADRVNISRSGSTLTIRLEPGDGKIEVLEARVVMPALESIDLSGVVSGYLVGFEQPQLTINVQGVSRLYSSSLKIGSLSARVSGVSMLDLGDSAPLASADIELDGVSQATLNMDIASTLTGAVSTGQGTGVSILYYYGTDVQVDVATNWPSQVIHLGGTRL